VLDKFWISPRIAILLLEGRAAPEVGHHQPTTAACWRKQKGLQAGAAGTAASLR